MEGIRMQCPNCRFENPEGMKFCGECGSKLELKCPNCGFGNTISFKFCGECGHKLSAPAEPVPARLSFEDKLDKIQRYLPRGLTEKILAQKDRIEGERKQITVMFCDMQGFTALSERLGPEEAYAIMDEVYEILIHKVHDYEGTVNEMTGDGIMALFGAPIALEDAPQRAIRSSLSIHREMVKFNDRMRQTRANIPALKMRIGIHSGPVVVGTMGNNLRVEFKAVGDTVNLASRTERLAEPGTTYLTEDTFKLTEGFFRFEALGERKIKGKAAPVNIYRAIAPSTRRTRFDVSAERGLTPFVGRGRELELLLDGFERSKAGWGQAFSIVAEAGVGKSRLLYEFRKAVSNENATFLEGKCLSYIRNVAYYPIIDTLKANFDVKEGDGDLEIKHKVIEGLKLLGVDEAGTLPYILELLSVKDSGLDRMPISPEAKKDRLMEAVKRITLKGSEVRPLIIATEDLHWTDRSSEEYLKRLLNAISGARIFLIFTYRPEFVFQWGGKSYHSQVTLNRLSNRESLKMVSHLLGAEELDKALEELILQKTEGIPLFIEEFVRSLKDLKAIESHNGICRLRQDSQAISIPATIQDVIMARVDALPEAAKEVLQIGAVIGREFNHELLKKVTALPEQKLLSDLSRLKDAELLYERGIFPESTYIFKHALTAEVIYNSILGSKKKTLHEKIGQAIADAYPDKLEAQYEILADHFVEAGNYEKGAEYLKLAGKKARQSAAFEDAIALGNKRSACLEKLPRSEQVDKQLIDARVTLGLYYNQMSLHVKAKEAVEPIHQLAVNHGYERRVSQINTILGTYSFTVEGDYAKSFKYLKDALRIANAQNDFASLWVANHWIGHAFSESCEFEKALYHLKNALAISEAANLIWSISIMKSCMALNAYVFQGQIDLGHQISLEGLKLAEESGDPLSMAEAYTSHGFALYYKGSLNRAEEYLLKGNAVSERINYAAMLAVASWALGDIYIEMQAYQKAKDYIKKQLSLAEGLGLRLYMDSTRISLARAKIMTDDSDIDFESLRGWVTHNKVKLHDGFIRRCVSEIISHTDEQNLADAQNWIQQAIDTDKRNGTRWQLGRDYAHYAELFKREGDRAKAKETLGRAIEIFETCGADGWVAKYQKELNEL
jgi:class 3 adenylate cyclase/tetratricopeptide (TPR) repeat protein